MLSKILPGPVRRSYAAKFALALLAVVVVVAGVGLFIHGQAEAQLSEDLKGDLQRSADIQRDQLDRYFGNRRAATAIVAQKERARGDPAALQGDLGSLSQEEFVLSTYLVDLSAAPENAVLTGAGPQGLADGSELTLATQSRIEEIAAKARSNPDGAAVGDGVVLGQISPDPEVTDATWPWVALVVAPVPDSSRAVVTVVNVSAVGEAMLHPPRRGRVLVTDSEGSPQVARTREGFQNQLAYTEGLDSAGTDAAGLGYVTTQRGGGGPQVAVGYAAMNSTDWYVTRQEPTSQAFALQDTILTGILGILLTMLVGMGFIAITLGQNTAVAISDLATKAQRIEDGEFEEPIRTDREDEIGDLYRSIDSMRNGLRERIREAREARRESEELSDHLQSRADEYGDVMTEAARGDLTVRLERDEYNEAMDEIAVAFNRMMDELSATVRETRQFAGEVNDASQRAVTGATEVREASEEVAESVQSISEDAKRQNDQLQSVSDEIEGLSTTVEEIAASSNEVAEIAERTAETGREGREAAQRAIAGMDQIEASTDEAIEGIRQLDEEVSEIDELAAFIEDVANETNRLALNANIEASRSGEGGGDGGFAVVAEEIKDLAAETKEAVDDIEARIERIQTQCEDCNATVEEAGAQVTEHAESVRTAAEALDEIAGYAVETNEGVQDISEATQQQADSTEEVVIMVEEVAEISKGTTRKSERVTEVADDQTASIRTVSETVEVLSSRARQLYEQVDSFEVGDGRTGGRPAGDGTSPADVDVDVDPGNDD